jgi:CHAD domain-containing protein
MKKVRAFGALNRAGTPTGKASEARRQLRKLYRQTGHVRQQALNREALQRLAASSAPVNDSAAPGGQQANADLKQRADAANAWVRRQISWLRASAQSLTNKQLRRHFRLHIRQLHRQFRRMESVEELHDCRKTIKNLVYQYGALPPRIQRKVPLNASYLESVEEAIGQWHDAALALEWGLAQQLVDPSALARLERECAALLEQALKKTRNFKSKAEIHTI